MIKDNDIAKAAELILQGELVAFATETVYGLGADATKDAAVAKIYALKKRPQFNPLIAHFKDVDHVKEYVLFSSVAQKLADAFWPGPLTLVVQKKQNSSIGLLASAGLETLGVRIPDHKIARSLIEACGVPLVAPSANASGKISPTKADHVKESFGDHSPFILDGGDCMVGLESTIVDVSSDVPKILRPGIITKAQIESVVGLVEVSSSIDAIKAPGMLKSHYAPNHPLFLNIKTPEKNQAYLSFGSCDLDGPLVFHLSLKGDLLEAASNLFSYLRLADDLDVSSIAVAPIPHEGIGLAICDRLMRAATPSF